jgi:hypothetical protein
MIVSSIFVDDLHTQADGRNYVTEAHIDSAGGVHHIAYLAEAGADRAALLAVHAARLAESLAAAEFETTVQ